MDSTAVKNTRLDLRRISLLLGVLILASASQVRAACNWADLPFGFSVATFTYSIQTGNYNIGANTFQYLYPAAVSTFVNQCNLVYGVGNAYAQNANKRAY